MDRKPIFSRFTTSETFGLYRRSDARISVAIAPHNSIADCDRPFTFPDMLFRYLFSPTYASNVVLSLPEGKGFIDKAGN